MFGFFSNMFDGASRAEKEAARESQRRQHAYEQQQRERMAHERQARIDGIRVFTGELKHRYHVIETLRGIGIFFAPPQEAEYDPMEATRRAMYHLQEQAADLGADAVVHARYQILRYLQSTGQRAVPVYEVHAFGTAVRIIGQSPDLDDVMPNGPHHESEND